MNKICYICGGVISDPDWGQYDSRRLCHTKCLVDKIESLKCCGNCDSYSVCYGCDPYCYKDSNKRVYRSETCDDWEMVT